MASKSYTGLLWINHRTLTLSTTRYFFHLHCIAVCVPILCYLRFHFSHGRIMSASVPSFLVFLLSMCQVEAWSVHIIVSIRESGGEANSSNNKNLFSAVHFSHYTVNLCLVTNKYKNPSWTNITVPQKYVFDFKE